MVQKRTDPVVSVVIVTHNSGDVITSCMQSLDRQSRQPARIVIIDSGSENPEYLERYTSQPNCTVQLAENIGFSAANNLGLLSVAPGSEFVLFVNPDVILTDNAVQQFCAALGGVPEAASISGVLLGYDFTKSQPTGRYDSTGVFRNWYGRWYDRDQGRIVEEISRAWTSVPALCGALMFCRVDALKGELPELFDESFFMYKEDVDLCLRLRKAGWKLIFDPDITAYHGRGWAADRKAMSRQARLLAARNEIRLNVKHLSPYILWAVLKYVLVKFLNI